jgi:hypothetical protein
MSERQELHQILSQSKKNEEAYEWLEAAASYNKALILLEKPESSSMGDIQERLGYSFFRAAMQSEKEEDFRERMNQAAASFNKAKECYASVIDPLKDPKISRCDAMVSYIIYWLQPSAREKKHALNECWMFAKKSLEGFEKAGEKEEYGKTFNQLSTSIDLAFFLEWDRQNQENMLKEAINCGEKAISLFSQSNHAYQLSCAYAKTATYVDTYTSYFIESGAREDYIQKSNNYWKKAIEFSEEAAHLALLSFLGGPSSDWGWGSEKSIKYYEKSLEYAKRTKDKLLIGCAFDYLALHMIWRAYTFEDPRERDDLANKTLKYAEEATCQYKPISFISPRTGVLWVEAPYAEHLLELAYNEADLNKRRDLLAKAARFAQEGFKRADLSGYPEVIQYINHIFSKILTSLATIEIGPEERKNLLEKALEYRNKSTQILEPLLPMNYWAIGTTRKYLADIKTKLADFAKDPATKREAIEGAIKEIEIALDLCFKDFLSYRKEAPDIFFERLGKWQYEYGDMLRVLYQLTNYKEHLEKTGEVFKDAAKFFQKINLTSRMAECYWKAALVYDELGMYLKSAENFGQALLDYKRAVENIPQLKEVYEETAIYMQAWTEIEKAKYYHQRQEYDLAREHFNNAGNLHKPLKHWGYLATNYFAWAQIEYAEDLSRNEKGDESLQAFREAIKIFESSKRSMQEKIDVIDDLDEKRMVTNMIIAINTRQNYCEGRICLEEAKTLDKKGDHLQSSEKYGLAAETFEKMSKKSEHEQDTRELKHIAILSRAWQKMGQADAEGSPTLFAEASQLFEAAKDLTPSANEKMLVLGHSRFCKALEAGAKFSDTKDITLHTNATECLESASNYYIKAEFQKGAEYARATGLLFDAYMYIDKAKKEKQPDMKTKLYDIIEKLLETSADIFMKSDYQEKMNQVLKILEDVKDDRKVASSLLDMLHAPSMVTTSSFAAPTPTYEEAVGLEAFERADIKAKISSSLSELKVGERLKVELELVNAGKGSALLVEVTEFIPKGFELIEKPESYIIEDGNIRMKGRRLDPLKVEDVRVVLKPKLEGTFLFKPRVLYLDEKGRYQKHNPDPVKIRVIKEIGIKEWFRGGI